MKNIIFYSKYRKDVNSPRLLELLRGTDLAREFHYYCIDENASQDALFLLEVDKIPTMYANGEKFVGDEARQWVVAQLGHMTGAPSHAPSEQMSSSQPVYSRMLPPTQVQRRLPNSNSNTVEAPIKCLNEDNGDIYPGFAPFDAAEGGGSAQGEVRPTRTDERAVPRELPDFLKPVNTRNDDRVSFLDQKLKQAAADREQESEAYGYS